MGPMKPEGGLGSGRGRSDVLQGVGLAEGHTKVGAWKIR